LSLSRTDSTSTTPCAETTHLPVALVLHRLCHAPRLLVSRLHGLYLTHCLAARLLVGRASGHCVSRRDYSSSGLHRLYCAYAVHPDAPSRRSTSRQSVALALAVCPVIPLCVVTTRLASATDILRLSRASRCLGMSRGSSSTTSPTLRVRVPRHVARLVVDYFASRSLVIDYFDYAARPGASARRTARPAARRRLLHLRRASGCFGMSHGLSRDSSSTTPHRAARHAARRRLLRLVQARRRLLRLRRASGCLVMLRGSSRGSSSTTSPSPRVRVPRHVARLVTRLVVDYFSFAARPGALARRAARHAARHRLLRLVQARRRLLRLRRASGCLGTSRGSSRGSSRRSSSTTPHRAVSSSTSSCAATLSCGHTGSTSATPCVAATCLAATLALLRVRREPPRRRLPVASRRPFILISFPN
jgi:hypothetical protein